MRRWSSNTRHGSAVLPTEPAVHLLRGSAAGARGRQTVRCGRESWESSQSVAVHHGAPEQAGRYAQQAVEVARHVGDPGVLAFTLECYASICHGGQRRPRSGSPMLPKCCNSPRRLTTRELICNAHGWRLIYLLDLGNIQAAGRRDRSLWSRLAEKLQEPSYLYCHNGIFAAMRALSGGPLCRGGAAGPAGPGPRSATCRSGRADWNFR